MSALPGAELAGPPHGRARVVKPSELPRWRRLAPSPSGVRATVAGTRAGTLPRARADRWLLLALTLVVTFSALLAVAVPRLLTRTYDEGARAAITNSGTRADLAISFPVAAKLPSDGAQPDAPPQLVSVKEMQDSAAALQQNLPAALARQAGPLQQTIAGPTLTTNQVAGPNGGEWVTPQDFINVLASVIDSSATGGSASPAVRYVAGHAPVVAKDPTKPGRVPIAVSQAAARRLQLRVGSRLRVNTPVQRHVDLDVTGIYVPVDPAQPTWDLLPGGVTPEESTSPAGTYVSITGLLDPSTVTTAELAMAPESMTVLTNQSIDPAGLTARTADDLAAAAAELTHDPSKLLPDRESVALATGLDRVVSSYGEQASATRAQLSLVLVGVVGAASVVMVLGAHLLVSRRREGLALEHARGASVASVSYRLLLESVVLTALGCGIGVLAASALVPGVGGSFAPLAVVAAVAALAVPCIGGWTARRTWARRRSPANRRARGRLAAGARARRLVGELTVVALAVGAVVALRNRGLLASDDAGIDLLLAAAPLLIALAVTIVVLHLYPYPIRLVAAVARRGRGGVLHLAASRAQGALSTLPLLALTVAFALVVMAGLVRGSLSLGQEVASWERTVGDARLTSATVPITEEQIVQVSRADGVDLAVPATVLPNLQLRVGTSYQRINVVAVDGTQFDRLLHSGPVSYAGEMTGIGPPPAEGKPLPVVATPGAVGKLTAQDSLIFVAQTYVPIKPVATASVAVAGWLPGDTVFVDRETLAAMKDSPVAGANALWAVGPGAAAAVESAATADQSVTSRVAWIAEQRSSGLLDDLLVLLWLAVIAVGALAAIALIETIVSGARERGRTLSFIRTLGFTVRQGRMLTFGELVPLVLTGIVAGTLAGVGIVALLGPALGLIVTTGGVTDPALRFDPPFAVAVAACAVGLLVLAVIVETAARRRDRLAEVLRVGDTR
jgi:putative ABC transport system permease protein